MSDNQSPAQRLARLRELANTTTTPNHGPEQIAALLEQEPGAPEVTCPRLVALAEHAGERMLICEETPAALLETLQDWCTGDPPHRPEATIDLDTRTRLTTAIAFTPPLPADGRARLFKITGAQRAALKLAANVTQEHGEDGTVDLAQATKVIDVLLASHDAAPLALSD